MMWNTCLWPSAAPAFYTILLIPLCRMQPAFSDEKNRYLKFLMCSGFHDTYGKSFLQTEGSFNILYLLLAKYIFIWHKSAVAQAVLKIVFYNLNPLVRLSCVKCFLYHVGVLKVLCSAVWFTDWTNGIPLSHQFVWSLLVCYVLGAICSPTCKSSCFIKGQLDIIRVTICTRALTAIALLNYLRCNFGNFSL